MDDLPLHGEASIWLARDLLKEGLLWRIGDGETVRIWHDRWFPSTINTFAVQSPQEDFSRRYKGDKKIIY